MGTFWIETQRRRGCLGDDKGADNESKRRKQRRVRAEALAPFLCPVYPVVCCCSSKSRHTYSVIRWLCTSHITDSHSRRRICSSKSLRPRDRRESGDSDSTWAMHIAPSFPGPTNRMNARGASFSEKNHLSPISVLHHSKPHLRFYLFQF